jgi:hypothetical protein
MIILDLMPVIGKSKDVVGLMYVQVLKDFGLHARCNLYCHTKNEELGLVQIQPISSDGHVSGWEVKYHNHRYHK